MTAVGSVAVASSDRRLCAEAEADELTRQRRAEACHYALVFLIKIFTLLIAVILSGVGGAYLFMALERTNELTICEKVAPLYQEAESDLAIKLETMSVSYNSFDESNQDLFLASIQQAVRNFSINVVLALQYDGRNCSLMGTPQGVAYNWDFYGALLFSTTVMTTVGYGNIAPVTFWGRLVCICYAMMTIPIVLLCLASMGEVMAEVFRYVYINVCCLGTCRRAAMRRTAARRRAQAPPLPPGGPWVGKPIPRMPGAPNLSNPANPSAIPALITPGAAGGAASRPPGLLPQQGRVPAPMGPGSAADPAGQGDPKANLLSHGGASGEAAINSRRSSTMPNVEGVTGGSHLPHQTWMGRYRQGTHSHHMTNLLDDFDDDEDDEFDDAPIPITLILIVVAAYIALGAVLFCNWEGWDVMTGVYYCFITVATIGFGDIIPGTVLSKGQAPQAQAFKFMVICVYMLTGMAFISMAFELVQLELTSKIRVISEAAQRRAAAQRDGEGQAGRQAEGDTEKLLRAEDEKAHSE